MSVLLAHFVQLTLPRRVLKSVLYVYLRVILLAVWSWKGCWRWVKVQSFHFVREAGEAALK